MGLYGSSRNSALSALEDDYARRRKILLLNASSLSGRSTQRRAVRVSKGIEGLCLYIKESGGVGINYTSEIFGRLNIQHIREFLLHGANAVTLLIRVMKTGLMNYRRQQSGV